MSRFVLLEHVGHPDDPAGRHFDLLLEEAAACRTWRLAEMPTVDGPAIAASPLPEHRLIWLDRLEGEVSGGRGFARRVDAGQYEWQMDQAAEEIRLFLKGSLLSGQLTIVDGLAQLR
jgi:hypothetical protein